MANPVHFQIRISGPQGDRVERLDRSEIVIGRSAQCDIIIANVEVSRRHLTMKIEGQQVMIRDEGSKNGTLMDDHKVQESGFRPWRPGQVLQLGRAPEKLRLESVAVASPGSEAPPVIPAKPEPKKEEAVPRDSIGSFVLTPETSPNLEARVVARAEHATSPGSSVSFLGDLEKRVQEIMKRAEEEAAQAREKSDREVREAREKSQREIALAKSQFEKDRQASEEQVKAARLEVAKLQSQLRDFEAELKARQDERKTVAREHADAKLATQNLRSEVERLTAARDQLGQNLSEELKGLEGRVTEAQSLADKDIQAIKSKTQKEIKDQLEIAKRQAEMLVSEAELKAKNQRERLAMTLADERKAAELDLAEMKLKQTAEIKAAQEREEARWQKTRAEVVRAFLTRIRGLCDDMVKESNLDSNVRLRLLTMLEDNIHRYFVIGLIDGQGAPAPAVATPTPTASTVPVPPAPAVTAPPPPAAAIPRAPAAEKKAEESRTATDVRILEEVTGDYEALTPWWQNRKTLGAVGVTMLVGLMVGGFIVNRQSLLAQSQMASNDAPAAQSTPIPAAAQPAPQGETSTAPPVEAARNAMPAPAALAEAPQPAAIKAALPSSPPTWGDVLESNRQTVWEDLSSRFMIQNLKLDRKRVAQYREMEKRFAASMNEVHGRDPAANEDRKRAEIRFIREASRLMGISNWQKFGQFRDRFLRSSH